MVKKRACKCEYELSRGGREGGVFWAKGVTCDLGFPLLHKGRPGKCSWSESKKMRTNLKCLKCNFKFVFVPTPTGNS